MYNTNKQSAVPRASGCNCRKSGLLHLPHLSSSPATLEGFLSSREDAQKVRSFVHKEQDEEEKHFIIEQFTFSSLCIKTHSHST